MTSKTIYYCVYRITNTVEKKHYYGFKSSDIHPSKIIGVTYFSSLTSAEGKAFRKDQKDNPQNYKYKIVQLFETAELAYTREIKLHAKFDVKNHLNFYNKSNQTSTGFSTAGKIVAKDLNGNKLGMVNSDDPRWKTGEIVSIHLGVKQPNRKKPIKPKPVKHKVSKPNKLKGVKRNSAGAKDLNGNKLGAVSLDDPRWKTREIVASWKGIKHKTPSKFKGTNRNSAAALDLNGNKLGFVNSDDPRWKTGEIISPNKGKIASDETRKRISLNHADFSGENNSFFGKTHSDESKLKIGSRDYSSSSKAVIVDGIRYKSKTEARRILNLPFAVIDTIIKTGIPNTKYNIQTVIYE